MPARLIPTELLDFLLFDWLRLDRTLARPAFAEHDADSIRALTGLAEKLAHDAFLPHYKAADRDEPRLEDGKVRVHPAIAPALARFTEAGFLAAPFPPELGGLGVPELAQAASMAQFMAANLASAAYPMLTIANARLLARYGTPAQAAAFLAPQLDGRALGTMCLSEPQAGSSLADVRSRAVPDGEGHEADPLGPRYRISGNKMWISGGDHDLGPTIVHLVLAKIPGPDGQLPAGTAGLSLFLVPKHREGGQPNDIAVAGLNHKMGYRGTSNCLLNFGEKTGAIGYRIGAAGQGLHIMFHMMNEARIGVALGAAAVAVRAHELSLDYARTRLQGRTGPGGDPVPIARHPDVARQLMRQKAYAEGALSFILFCAALVDDRETAPAPEARAAAERLLGLLTPAAKTWASEWGCAACDIAIQIHGGYGYTRDFDVEQLYRDNRLNPIHEGTTGIQGLDFAGRKLLKEKAAGLADLDARVSATLAEAAERGLGDEARALAPYWARVQALPGQLAAMERTDWMAGATELLDGFGQVVVAWLLLDQAVAARRAGHKDTRLALCRFFLDTELPRAARAFDIGTRPSRLPAEFFA